MLSVAPESGSTLTVIPVFVCVASMRGVGAFWTRVPFLIAATAMVPPAAAAAVVGAGGFFPTFSQNVFAYASPLKLGEAELT